MLFKFHLVLWTWQRHIKIKRTLHFSWCTLQSCICKYTCEIYTCTIWILRVSPWLWNCTVREVNGWEENGWSGNLKKWGASFRNHGLTKSWFRPNAGFVFLKKKSVSRNHGFVKRRFTKLPFFKLALNLSLC